MGGNTRTRPFPWQVSQTAAMEPPGNGRKHARRYHGCPVREAAAMEPPGNGRKHPGTRGRPAARPAPPQWSRPVMGGNTADAELDAASMAEAAMEPPGNGRKHMNPPFSNLTPWVEPQWSRPVMGGNTWRDQFRL